MPNIDVVDGMALGVGVDLGGQIFGDGVLRTAPEVVGGGQTSDIFLTLVETQDDLSKALNLSTEVSAAFGAWGGSAKFNLAQSMQVHQYSVTLVIRASVLNSFAQMRDVQFSPFAAGLIKDGKTDVFRTQFGDYFIRGTRKGGELCAILQIFGRDTSDQSDIKLSLQASGILGSVTASTNDSFSSVVQRATQRRETRFKHTQIGGTQIASIDPVELVNHALSFAASVRDDNSELYGALAVPYTTVDSPDHPNYIDITGAKENIEIIMRSRRDAMTRLGDFQFVAGHPEQFEIPGSMNVGSIVGQFEDAIAKYTSAASLCVNHPSEAQTALQSASTVAVPLDVLPPRRNAAQYTPRGLWTTQSSVSTGRCTALVPASNGKLYAIGGGTRHGGVNLVDEYDPQGNAWTSRSPLPTARQAAAAAAPNGKIYAIGGTINLQPVANVDEFDPATNAWRNCSPMTTPRTGHAVVTGANGKIYAFGGTTREAVGIDSVEEYDPLADRWTTRATMPTARTSLGAAASRNGRIYVAGGLLEGKVLSNLEEFDPATNRWAARAPMPTARRALAVTAALSGRLYAVAGSDANRAILAIVEEYDPTTDSWVTKSPLANPRSEPAAATGNDGTVYVLGGQFIQNLTVTDLAVLEAYVP